MTLSYQILQSMRNTDFIYSSCYDELFLDKDYPYDDDEEEYLLPSSLEDRAASYIEEEDEIHYGELLECVLEYTLDLMTITASRRKEELDTDLMNRFCDEWTYEIAIGLRAYLMINKITFTDENGVLMNNPQSCLFDFERSRHHV